MRIFIVHEDIYHAGNPYIYTLVEGITALHKDVEFGWGMKEFWDESIFSYDIVHFQWPQAFMANDGGKHTIEDLNNWIVEIKNHGVKVVSTCHDLEPHYSQCSEFGNAFSVVYKNCDAIFHLGEYSLQLFERKYPTIKHYIIPHHIYDTIYDNIPSRSEACKALNLNPKKKYILCFGTFRAEEERDIVKLVARKFKDYEILAPGFMDIQKVRRFSFLPNSSERRAFLYKHWYKIHMTGRTWNSVPDAQLPFYYAVSDICLIQRKKILNSGNAILPMLFDKVVVGPDTGNVGPLLKSIGYPTFKTNDDKSIIIALTEAMELQKSGIAAEKHNHFLYTYSTATISQLLLEMYKRIL